VRFAAFTGARLRLVFPDLAMRAASVLQDVFGSQDVGLPRRRLGAYTTLVAERRVWMFDSFEELEKADDAVFAALTPQERLDLLMHLMERYRERFGEAGQRFERVCRVRRLSDPPDPSDSPAP
jgi:hypothetical protein